jgi:hypothetical protein
VTENVKAGLRVCIGQFTCDNPKQPPMPSNPHTFRAGGLGKQQFQLACDAGGIVCVLLLLKEV